MTIPDWKRFEQLAAAIQRELAPDARVTENAKLMGKSGSERQIDILIEQDTGQFELRIAIGFSEARSTRDAYSATPETVPVRTQEKSALDIFRGPADAGKSLK